MLLPQQVGDDLVVGQCQVDDLSFEQPTDLSVGKDGLIYVLDGVNQCVKVFAKNGKYKFSFGKEGSGKGEFQLPVGLDVDREGDVYVADSGNHRVQVFGPRGKFKAEISLQNRKKNYNN